MDEMQAVTLWQPWATLIALGVKTIETRSWRTNHRGPLAIHAAKRPPTDIDRIGDWRVGRPNYDSRWWMTCDTGRYAGTQVHLPLGAVVATCTLGAVLPMVNIYGAAGVDDAEAVDRGLHALSVHSRRVSEWDGGSIIRVHDDQLPYGDFAPGRYGWLLDDIDPVRPSIPATGRQQLWRWSDPR